MRTSTTAATPTWFATGGMILALSGCGGDDAAQPAPGPCTELEGVCVGVPPEAVCAADPCTDGAACANVLTAANDGELANAVAQAGSGDCIALAPGAYGAVDLPGGVSLLGRTAEAVSVGAVTLSDGAGAWVRGMAIEGGLDVGSATDVRIEAVRVSGGNSGLRAGPGASVTLARSEIGGSAGFGVLGVAPASVALDHSIITEAAAAGIWLRCDEDEQADPCACAVKPVVSLDHVLLQHNHYLSAGFRGTEVTLRTVHIVETLAGANFEHAGGLGVMECSMVDAAGVQVTGLIEDSLGWPTGFGILIDGSSASFGPDLNGKGIIIINTKPGVWIQAIGASPAEPDQSVSLEGVEVSDCYGTGIGLDLEAKGIIIINTKVASTFNGPMPVEGIGAPADMGLGVVWKAASTATIDGLEVSGSATGYGLIIDGPVGTGSSLANVTLSGGDEAEGIVQQRVDAQDETPTTGAGVSDVQTTSDKVVDVPVGPEAPAAGQ